MGIRAINMGDSEPVVRVVRKTEAFNPLLQRVVLGKSKRSTYGLPQNQFVYGKPNIHDGEGCAEVLSTWVEHHANPDSLPGRDFMALNKRATISKMTTRNRSWLIMWERLIRRSILKLL